MSRDKDFLRPRSRPYMQRPVDEQPTRHRFLIVCEGGKTEPLYFERFRVPSIVVKIEGLGMNTLSLVRKTIELRDQDDYDQTWCVFDKDDFPVNNFNEALALAERNHIEVAYSNQAFELWYVLHFVYMDNAIARADYMSILDKHLGHKYEKNSGTVYDELSNRQPTAIRNASNLLAEYNPPRPAMDDPSTTVHLLVEQLVKYSKPF